jgi:hypothetical protein
VLVEGGDPEKRSMSTLPRKMRAGPCRTAFVTNQIVVTGA